MFRNILAKLTGRPTQAQMRATHARLAAQAPSSRFGTSAATPADGTVWGDPRYSIDSKNAVR